MMEYMATPIVCHANDSNAFYTFLVDASVQYYQDDKKCSTFLIVNLISIAY